MASWSQFEAEAPELAAHARRILDGNVHKVLATLRRDGSPRTSGTEVIFAEGELWTGSMWKAVKALDLRRDPRCSIHSCVPGGDDWTGDAKLSGRLLEVDDDATKARVVGGNAPPGPLHLFRADLEEVAVVHLNPERTKLLIDAWHPGRGVQRLER